jgi:23S rRNA (guanosine2251-2'-O)-methyltransferase
MRHLALIAHNLRSTHNVGSLLRTADGLGIQQVWLTGYTPYPSTPHDERLPHLAQKIDRQITKTALGAEKTVSWRHEVSLEIIIKDLKHEGFMITALEQASFSIPLTEFKPPEKLALIVGREVEGIEPEVLAMCDQVLEIPMLGSKESYNVVQAAAMALYQLRVGAL